MSNFKHDSGLGSDTKSSQEERDKLMKEFLDKGGKIEKIKSPDLDFRGTDFPDLKS